MEQLTEMKARVAALNDMLSSMGLPQLDVVSPADCIPAPKNARYFKPEVFEQLVKNVKDAGHLESVPFVYRDEKLKEGQYRIISGHHRIKSAKLAGIPYIIVMIATDADQDKVTSKQLSHNALVGTDDQAMLKELYESIQDIEQKIASGVSAAVEAVQYQTLNMNPSSGYKTLVIVFAPEKLVEFKADMEAIAQLYDKGTDVMVAERKTYDDIVEQLKKIKFNENIKNNALALQLLTLYAKEWYDNTPYRKLEEDDKENSEK